jgi:deoxyhypusine synthase
VKDINKRTLRQYASGEELTPLETLDLKKINTFKDMLEAMRKTAFSGRQLGFAYDILYEVFTDPNAFVVLTLSGALTVAKQGQIICDLIDRGCVDVVISTGALLTHGLIEGMGVQHFMSEGLDDVTGYEKGYCRVYDTIELEKSFQSLEAMIGDYLERLFPALDGSTPPTGSADFCKRLGELCLEKFPNHPNIVASAAKKNVPVYIPAFTDSEMILDVSLQYIKRKTGLIENPWARVSPFPFNPFADLYDYANRIYKHEGTLAIFTLGGGVPRNWAQQVAPHIDIMIQQGFPMEHRVFSRGVRICPEPVHWGGLSGCTYREGISWGKFIPEEEGGKYAEVPCEITAVFPLLIKAVFERMDSESEKRLTN